MHSFANPAALQPMASLCAGFTVCEHCKSVKGGKDAPKRPPAACCAHFDAAEQRGFDISGPPFHFMSLAAMKAFITIHVLIGRYANPLPQEISFDFGRVCTSSFHQFF